MNHTLHAYVEPAAQLGSERQPWPVEAMSADALTTPVPAGKGAFQRVILVILVMCVLVGILCASGFVAYIYYSLAEVRAMGPWPSPAESPDVIAAVDLSSLGLNLDTMMDARKNEVWSQANYENGALAIYQSGGVPTAAIWALRYGNAQTANRDYQSAAAYFQAGCGRSGTAYFGNTGIIYCSASDGVSKIFWNDRWIMHIWAASGTDYDPAVLVNQVRDAAAAHWLALPGGAN